MTGAYTLTIPRSKLTQIPGQTGVWPIPGQYQPASALQINLNSDYVSLWPLLRNFDTNFGSHWPIHWSGLAELWSGLFLTRNYLECTAWNVKVSNHHTMLLNTLIQMFDRLDTLKTEYNYNIIETFLDTKRPVWYKQTWDFKILS